MQLSPGETYPLIYQIPDKSDTNTYYLRAVIRRGGTTLETVNLVNQTGGRFLYNWTVPVDGNGNGTWIDIEITPYTDSGYTTPSGLYGTKHEAFLIQTRVNAILPAVRGASVDYTRIKEEVMGAVKGMMDGMSGQMKEHIMGMPKPEKVDIPKTDLSPIIDAIDSSTGRTITEIGKTLTDGIKGMTQDVISALDAVIERIENHRGENEQALSDMLQRFDDAAAQLDAKEDPQLKEAIGSMRDFFGQYMQREDKLEASMADMKKQLKAIRFIGLEKQAEEKEEEANPFQA